MQQSIKLTIENKRWKFYRYNKSTIKVMKTILENT